MPPELPRRAHVPGQPAAPDHERLAAAAAGWRGARPGDRRFDAGLDHALRLLRESFFWEAHEILEPLWQSLPPNSRERATLRGIIQLANAGLKLRMGRPKAALRLLADAEEALMLAGAVCMSLDVAALLGRIAAERARLTAGLGSELTSPLYRICKKMPEPG